MRVLTVNRHVLRMRGAKGDEARAAEHKKTLEAKLQAYEVILSKQKYLAGDVSHSLSPISEQAVDVCTFVT